MGTFSAVSGDQQRMDVKQDSPDRFSMAVCNPWFGISVKLAEANTSFTYRENVAIYTCARFDQGLSRTTLNNESSRVWS
jgi:hypothetical protein